MGTVNLRYRFSWCRSTFFVGFRKGPRWEGEEMIERGKGSVRLRTFSTVARNRGKGVDEKWKVRDVRPKIGVVE